VLFSPGSGGDRDSSTNQVEDLVSHGYTVVTIDHTHDSAEVEFPGGRVEGNTIPPDTIEINTEATRVRAADTRFVLDQLCAINAGRSPDVEHRPLPAGIAGTLDVGRVGMFGHSMGGATTAWAMLDDRRILAGINLDGAFYGPVVDAGLDRPFLLMSSQDHNRDDDDTWAALWSHLRGWRRDLRLLDSGHLSYNDVQILLPPAAGAIGYPPDVVRQFLGTIDPVRAVLVVRTYLRGFMDLHLRHRGTDLFDGPTPRYPEIQFVP
jgi:pimeloyl-ACP methyl ester carboxylesterase